MKRKIDDKAFISPWMIVIVVGILILAGLAAIVVGTDTSSDDANPITENTYIKGQATVKGVYGTFGDLKGLELKDVSSEVITKRLSFNPGWIGQEKKGSLKYILEVNGVVTHEQRTEVTVESGEEATSTIDLGPVETESGKTIYTLTVELYHEGSLEDTMSTGGYIS